MGLPEVFLENVSAFAPTGPSPLGAGGARSACRSSRSRRERQRNSFGENVARDPGSSRAVGGYVVSFRHENRVFSHQRLWRLLRGASAQPVGLDGPDLSCEDGLRLHYLDGFRGQTAIHHAARHQPRGASVRSHCAKFHFELSRHRHRHARSRRLGVVPRRCLCG